MVSKLMATACFPKIKKTKLSPEITGIIYNHFFFKATIRSRTISVPRKLPVIKAPCSPATSPIGMDHPILKSPDNIPTTKEISTNGRTKNIFLFMT